MIFQSFILIVRKKYKTELRKPPMLYTHTAQKSSFLKIVYSKVKVNGREELVPMELYTDGSVKRCEF